MSLTTMIERMSQPFQIEFQPPDRRDAVQAVLYRVGEPFDVLDTRHPLAGASLEAITDRLLPQLGHRRRRWISAVRMDEPGDLSRPPHQRPGLVVAAALGHALPGGLLAEREDDFGADPVHRAVVISWLANNAGTLAIASTDMLAPDIASAPAATFTIGDLKNRSGRRPSATARSDRTVQDHVRQLSQHARRSLISSEQRSRYEDEYQLFHAATQAVWPTFNPAFLVNRLATSSQLVEDLSSDAAMILARDLMARGTHPERASQTLQLAGYINPSGHRLWRKELVQAAGGDHRAGRGSD